MRAFSLGPALCLLALALVVGAAPARPAQASPSRVLPGGAAQDCVSNGVTLYDCQFVGTQAGTSPYWTFSSMPVGDGHFCVQGSTSAANVQCVGETVSQQLSLNLPGRICLGVTGLSAGAIAISVAGVSEAFNAPGGVNCQEWGGASPTVSIAVGNTALSWYQTTFSFTPDDASPTPTAYVCNAGYGQGVCNSPTATPTPCGAGQVQTVAYGCVSPATATAAAGGGGATLGYACVIWYNGGIRVEVWGAGLGGAGSWQYAQSSGGSFTIGPNAPGPSENIQATASWYGGFATFDGYNTPAPYPPGYTIGNNFYPGAGVGVGTLTIGNQSISVDGGAYCSVPGTVAATATAAAAPSYTVTPDPTVTPTPTAKADVTPWATPGASNEIDCGEVSFPLLNCNAIGGSGSSAAVHWSFAGTQGGQWCHFNDCLGASSDNAYSLFSPRTCVSQAVVASVSGNVEFMYMVGRGGPQYAVTYYVGTSQVDCNVTNLGATDTGQSSLTVLNTGFHVLAGHTYYFEVGNNAGGQSACGSLGGCTYWKLADVWVDPDSYTATPTMAPSATAIVAPSSTPVSGGGIDLATCANIICACIQTAAGVIQGSVNGVTASINGVNATLAGIRASGNAAVAYMATAPAVIAAPIATGDAVITNAISGSVAPVQAGITGLVSNTQTLHSDLLGGVATASAAIGGAGAGVGNSINVAGTGIISALATPGAAVVNGAGAVATVAAVASGAYGRLDGAGGYIDGEFSVLETRYANMEATPQALLEGQIQQQEHDLGSISDQLSVGGECVGGFCVPHWSVADSAAEGANALVVMEGELAGIGASSWAGDGINLLGKLASFANSGGLDQALLVEAEIPNTIISGTNHIADAINSTPLSITSALTNTAVGLLVPQDLPSDTAPLAQLRAQVPHVTLPTVPQVAGQVCPDWSLPWFGQSVPLDICGTMGSFRGITRAIGEVALYSWTIARLFAGIAGLFTGATAG